MSINTVTISGRLTRDPELRVTPNGTDVVSFGLAYNERRKVNEEWQEIAHFFDCTAWSGFGKLLASKLSKGSSVTVTGRLTQRSWENDAGEKRSKVEIVVNDVEAEDMYKKADENNQIAMAGTASDDIPF